MDDTTLFEWVSDRLNLYLNLRDARIVKVKVGRDIGEVLIGWPCASIQVPMFQTVYIYYNGRLRFAHVVYSRPISKVLQKRERKQTYRPEEKVWGQRQCTGRCPHIFWKHWLMYETFPSSFLEYLLLIPPDSLGQWQVSFLEASKEVRWRFHWQEPSLLRALKWTLALRLLFHYSDTWT